MIESEDLWVSCHLRCSDREAVERAVRAAAGTSPPVAVWPPRPLPAGILVSPPRYDWVSLWGTAEPCDALMGGLTGTLECLGLAFELAEDEGWWLRLLRQGYPVGGAVYPAGDGGPPDAGQGAQSDASDGWSNPALRDWLATLLPPGVSLHAALDLVLGPPAAEQGTSGIAFVEDTLETFANYFGIRDAAWDPRQDYETFAAGDYEDLDGLPEGWQSFILLPHSRWDIRSGP